MHQSLDSAVGTLELLALDLVEDRAAGFSKVPSLCSRDCAPSIGRRDYWVVVVV